MTVTTMNVVDILSKLKGITGVMGKIFEYDDTYKRIFTQEVIPNLWCESWKKKYNSITCSYERAVLGYLTENWGVWEDGHPGYSWHKGCSFPGNMSINKYIDAQSGRMMMNVTMSFNKYNNRVFSGMVLTKQQYKEECLEETPDDIRYLDVYEDTESGLTVYISFW